MRIRNLYVRYVSSNDHRGIVEQEFIDAFDFLDWLKQENLLGNHITIVGWNYREARL